ncbi:hypothetical protein E5288_WYG009345 [Bos mutus]|uniref:Uncharacterized protein n=1 Tax=Bos mutus TaxID=72004 RepID=A0A6B0RZL3_9CETA|nr:hypothetical protein [Bos mutus]
MAFNEVKVNSVSTMNSFIIIKRLKEHRAHGEKVTERGTAAVLPLTIYLTPEGRAFVECDRTHRKMTSAHAETDHLSVEFGLENANKVQQKMVKSINEITMYLNGRGASSVTSTSGKTPFVSEQLACGFYSTRSTSLFSIEKAVKQRNVQDQVNLEFGFSRKFSFSSITQMYHTTKKQLRVLEKMFHPSCLERKPASSHWRVRLLALSQFAVLFVRLPSRFPSPALRKKCHPSFFSSTTDRYKVDGSVFPAPFPHPMASETRRHNNLTHRDASHSVPERNAESTTESLSQPPP